MADQLDSRLSESCSPASPTVDICQEGLNRRTSGRPNPGTRAKRTLPAALAGDHFCDLRPGGKEAGGLSDEQSLHIRAHDLGGHSVELANVPDLDKLDGHA